MSDIVAIIEEKCPKCGEGKVFKRKGNPLLLQMPKMHQNCSVCGHKFEREPGYFFGSMYVSYGLTVAEMMLVFFITQFFVKDFTVMIGIIAIFAVLLSTFNFRFARMIWIYIFDGKDRSV